MIYMNTAEGNKYMLTSICERGSHSLAYKKSRTFAGPHNIFQDSFIAQQCLNMQTNGSYLLYIRVHSVNSTNHFRTFIKVAKKLSVNNVSRNTLYFEGQKFLNSFSLCFSKQQRKCHMYAC